MTGRDTQATTALRWFFALAGVGAFYLELLFFTARPVVIGATLTMMGYPLAAWLDQLRRAPKKEGDDK
jgi:hypothetical protein